MLGGKTAIEHILHSHWRAITDINWHNTDPNLVVSTAIDGWLWAWDLRTPQKPILGLCAFNGELLVMLHLKITCVQLVVQRVALR